MKRTSPFKAILGCRRGSVAAMVAISLVMLIGFAAISVDVGYLYATWGQLQAATEAAALAAAKDIGRGGSPIATATLYSALSGQRNAIPGVTTVMASGYPVLQCFQYGAPCGTNQTTVPANQSVNGIVVRQTATVPLFFATLLGYPSMTITTSSAALAGGNSLPPLNVMFIVDTTPSMANNDGTCGGTRIHCAVTGFEILLGQLWPCVYANDLTAGCGAVSNHNVAKPFDRAGVLTFPGVQAAPTGGSCANLQTVTYAGISGTTNDSTSTSSTTLHFAKTPAFVQPYGPQSLVTDVSQPANIKANTYIRSSTTTTAIMSATPASTISSWSWLGLNDTIAVWPPIYQIIPLSSDYRTSDAAGPLNLNSDLVNCLGSLRAETTVNTYYADAILIAQQTLLANAKAGDRNVIILLSDGDATATASEMVAQQGSPSSPRDQCKQAVINAQNAAMGGTWVYSVGYGIASGGCSSDSGSYKNACYTMSHIANMPGTVPGTYINDPAKFYSDNNGNNCRSAANPTITNLNSMFQNIAYSLANPRLLPAACVVVSPAIPPSWC